MKAKAKESYDIKKKVPRIRLRGQRNTIARSSVHIVGSKVCQVLLWKFTCPVPQLNDSITQNLR